MIIVRKHKGRSGISVYEWRVYRVIDSATPAYRKVHNIQLGKYRTQAEAERAAEHHRANDARVRAIWAARHQAELDIHQS